MNKYIGLPDIGDDYTVKDIIRDTFYYTTFYTLDPAGCPCILRVFKTSRLRPSEITLFKQEYEKLMGLEIKGLLRIIQTCLYQGRPAVISEFYEQFFLSDFIKGGSVEIADFFKIAISLAEILAGFHSNNMACLDIRPDNITYGGDSLKIIDFSSSLVLTKKNDQLFNEDVIRNSLPYISPEQTGRMNRAADYRSDLYSLGIILYELLTGHTPFSSDDPMDLIHSHIARMPVSPAENNKSIPGVLSAIIMRLIEKSPEERYRTAAGLLADLVRCANQHTSTGYIDSFSIGKSDISPDFIVPARLVGRETEIGTVKNILSGAASTNGLFNRGEDSINVVFIYGAAGCGKSALVDETRKMAAVNRIYCLTGKHQEQQHNAPYSAIIEALNGMIRLILSESNERIAHWRETIKNALGENGAIITNMLPDVELLIGRQPAVPDLPAEASQNRLIYTFVRFIRALASGGRGLVLVIEDIQWIDAASLNILKSMIVNRDIDRILFILSYRSELKDGIAVRHELPDMLKSRGIGVAEIEMCPLSNEETKRYIRLFAEINEYDSGLICDLVYKKTAGNPFYINQVMKSFHETGALYYNVSSGWHFDPQRINITSIPDTVIGLLSVRIASMPASEKKIMGICACLGSRFDIEAVADISDIHITDVFSAVSRGSEQGLVGFHDNDFYFTHDRIHEAFYSAIPEHQRAEIHLNAGKYMLGNISDDKSDDHTDIIAGHFQSGINAVTTDEERRTIAALNLTAARKAITHAAYHSALVYIKTAVDITGPGCWDTDYDLAVSLYTTASEAAYLAADFIFMEEMADIAFRRIHRFIDKIAIYEQVIQAHYAMNRMQQGLDQGLRVLRLLGRPLPENPGRLSIIAGLIKTKIRLSKKKYEELLSMGEMTSPEFRAVVKISNTMGINAYKIRPGLIPHIVFNAISLSISYGCAPETAYCFAAYGMIQCGAIGDIDTGYEYGNIAIRLSERPDGSKYRPRTIHLVYCMIWHWKHHLRDTIDHIKYAFTLGMEMGDIEDATSSAHLYCTYKFLCGYRLDEVKAEMLEYDHITRRFRQETNLNYLRIERQTVINLTEETEDPCVLAGAAYNESELYSVHVQAGDKTALAILGIQKMLLCFLFERFDDALKHAESAGRNIDALMALGFIPVYYFLDSLIRLAVYKSAPERSEKKLIKQVRNNLKRLNMWSENAPENNMHKCSLIQAELHGIYGDYESAAACYDRAIDAAAAGLYINEAAIANECAARFYHSRGNKKIAGVYLMDARGLYLQWGALAKAAFMESRYGEMLTVPGLQYSGNNAENSAVPGSFSTSGNPSLDFNSVVEALQTISGEIVLERFIDRLMKIIIKNAGASRGVLIISRNDELFATAECLAESTPSLLKKPEAISEYRELPLSIIHYTARSGQPVVIGNAVSDERFGADDYLRRRRSRSILCQPLINQQKLKGIIYLENELAADVFSPERMELVKLFSTQAAISLENAILFERSISAEGEILEQLEELQSQYEEMEAMNEELQSAYQNLDQTNIRLEQESGMLSIFRQFAESSAQGMGICDLQGRLVYSNLAFCKMTGIDNNGYQGRSVIDFFPESEREHVIKSVVPAVLEHGEFAEEIPFYDATNRLVPAIQTIFLLRDKNGSPAMFGSIITDITKIKESEKILRESEERYRVLVETMNDGLCLLDSRGNLTYLNKSLCNMLGYAEDELLGRHISALLDSANREIFEREFIRRQDGDCSIYEMEWQTSSGSVLSTIVSPKPVYDSSGNMTGSFGVITNITDRIKAEKEKERMHAQLLQSQKMEAVGTLAGGIAHDFNNMLTSIFGNTDMLLMRINESDPSYRLVREISKAAEKSAALTRQLLTFSRKQILETVHVDLDAVILEMEPMLRRLIGEDIDLVVKLDGRGSAINADKSQVEQIILNLAVNARDAMPDGGRLRIATSITVLDDKLSNRIPESRAGRFVVLNIEDTGTGMDADLMKNIFEPFFTTKEINKGTGLGLAVVYGIVKQHDGWINVESSVGEGTVFTVYIPVLLSESLSVKTEDVKKFNPGDRMGRGERILLVEDQEDVRKYVNSALAGFGYNVFQAPDVKSAIAMFVREKGDFDLLLSDVVLPDGKGIYLADSFLEKNPQLKIILSSGYTEQKFQLRIINEKHYNFLPKPYTLNTLLDLIKRVLAMPSDKPD